MHVGIVGGGISGLSAALLLRREGHDVTLFEASGRLGGRIHTHRFGRGADGRDVYFEAGAMRIPRSALHEEVFSLIKFLNAHNPPAMKVNLIPYILEHQNNKAFIKGQKLDLDDPCWGQILNIPVEFHGKSARTLLLEVVGPWLDLLRADFESGFQKVLEYDEYSFRQYLRTVKGWPHEVIEYVELMNSQVSNSYTHYRWTGTDIILCCSQTNQYDLSFTELIMQNLDFDTQQWSTVEGGMSNLIEACVHLVGRKNILVHSPVRSISERPDGKVELGISGQVGRTCAFDKVLLAMPTAAMHSIRQRPTWSFMKEQSLRGSWFEPLYKMGLHFRTRFWEHLAEPSFGGQR